MDEADRLARKLIDVFEALEGLLEELAVPEDLDDPEGVVDLWVVSEEVYGAEEEIVMQGQISVPTTIAFEMSAQSLTELFKEELLASEQMHKATTVAAIVGRALSERGKPSEEEARRN